MTSTPPVIFKRTKAKKALRTRDSSPGNDTETSGTTTGVDSPSTLAAKLKNKVKKKTKSRLSFGGDEDEESSSDVFKVKKSHLSQKLTLGKHPSNVPLNLDQATISPYRGPTYDQEHLRELKANTPSSRSVVAADPYDTDMSLDVGDVSVMSVDRADVSGISDAIIPSESSIKVARERRELLRKTGETDISGADDFVSLSVVRRVEDQGPHPESRLMREEDEVGDADDEFAEYTSAQERIALGKKSRKAEASKRRDVMKDMIADVEEQDEETMEWEQEQLRRGGHETPDSKASSASKVKQTYKPAPIPADTPVPTLGPAIARLVQQLSQLTTSHTNNTATLSSLAQERDELDVRETEMRDMVGRAEEKRVWFSSFNEWVEGVAAFLDEKYPLLEKLEEEHASLLKERFNMIDQRRRADDIDDLATFLGPLPLVQPSEPEVEQSDELSRVIPRPNPAILKRERREARIKRRQARRQKSEEEEEEGFSTDSSLSKPEASDYANALKSLAARTKDVLADVRAEDFRDPGKGRWSVWREKYADSYIGAWGGLGVVGVWEFWVRLEMVGWDCVEDPKSFDSFKWYKGLYEYSRPTEGNGGEGELGPDGDLVASMISTTVIPRIVAVLASGAFDVYSGRHVRRVVDLAEEVEASVDEGNAKLQILLKTITWAFESAIGSTETLLAKHKAVRHALSSFDPEAIPARRRFLNGQIKLLRNLVRWRKHTRERYGVDLLVKRIVGTCILDVAEGGWEVGGEEIARKAASIVPNDLIPNDLRRRIGQS